MNQNITNSVFADRQKGISLLIVFFLMMIVLAVVLSISTLLYSELKVIRNIGNSVVAFYAADSGIEKVLYYDWQVKPTGATRGLCAMLDSANPDYCSPTEGNSLSCINPTPSSFVGTCDPLNCTNCTISFDTNLGNGITYHVTASVSPSENPSFNDSDFDVKSKGSYGGASRQIDVPINATQ